MTIIARIETEVGGRRVIFSPNSCGGTESLLLCQLRGWLVLGNRELASAQDFCNDALQATPILRPLLEDISRKVADSWKFRPRSMQWHNDRAEPQCVIKAALYPRKSIGHEIRVTAGTLGRNTMSYTVMI